MRLSIEELKRVLRAKSFTTRQLKVYKELFFDDKTPMAVALGRLRKKIVAESVDPIQRGLEDTVFLIDLIEKDLGYEITEDKVLEAQMFEGD